MCQASPLLLKHLEMLGRAKATMPSRQADLDLNQKSACRKNQNKRPCPDHSVDGILAAILQAEAARIAAAR